MTKRQDLCLQRRSRPEQSDQRQPNQAANISHQPRASPDSTSLASRIEFPTMTVAPAVMRPTALALNILVAGFTSFRYVNAGLFRWRTLWPFLLGAMPFAFIGGTVQLPGAYYRPLVGVVLLIGGARLL